MDLCVASIAGHTACRDSERWKTLWWYQRSRHSLPAVVLGQAQARAGRLTKLWPLALLTVALLLGAPYGLRSGIEHLLQN